MKKLMVVASAAMVAALANAASIEWAVVGVKNGYDKGTDLVASGSAYLFNAGGDDTLWASQVAAITALVAAGDFEGLETASIGTASWDTGDQLYFGDGTITPFSGGDKANLFAVVLTKNQDWGYVTEVATSAPWSGIGSVPLYWEDESVRSAGSASWTQVAPEPTSGMLLLLGMGALALRRRRA